MAHLEHTKLLSETQSLVTPEDNMRMRAHCTILNQFLPAASQVPPSPISWFSVRRKLGLGVMRVEVPERKPPLGVGADLQAAWCSSSHPVLETTYGPSVKKRGAEWSTPRKAGVFRFSAQVWRLQEGLRWPSAHCAKAGSTAAAAAQCQYQASQAAPGDTQGRTV